MERAAPHITAAGTADDHGCRQPRAVARRRHVIREHVVGTRDEVNELHLRHWPETHVGRACCCSDDCRFGDGRVDHARLTEPLGESFRDFERPAVETDVFAEDENALVALHLLPESLAQRLEKSDFSHHSALNQSLSATGGSTNTPGSALSASGKGSSTQASVA